MLQWKEFLTWITIDGKEVIEYDVQTSKDKKTVTCMIASELGKFPEADEIHKLETNLPELMIRQIREGVCSASGRLNRRCFIGLTRLSLTAHYAQKFSVCWRNSSFPQDVGGFVKVDGTGCGGVLCSYQRDLGRTFNKNGVNDGAMVKPFVFSSLELTDDADALRPGSSSSLQDLGLIELTIVPLQRIALGNPIVYSLSDLKVHECSKKAVTQQIRLAAPELLEHPVPPACQSPIDLIGALFTDVLRANGIAPAPPQLKRKASTSVEHPRASTPDDAEELSALEEVKILREKLQRLEAKLQLKQEKKPRVKEEGGPVIDLTQTGARRKRVKLDAKRSFASGEVIDLT
ncbi:hypothetical protein B0H12DRAFT_1068047 [Mycena haematopus]|nr:hypothetical protein B0H12DRAFT_1068047 [Mycena haematopus]